MNNPWKVRNIELARGVPALPREEGIGGLYLVFWWQGVPLGHEVIDAGQLPMSVAQVEALALKLIPHVVGNHLFAHGFQAPLPSTPLFDCPPSLEAITATPCPLAAMQERYERAAPEATISLVICTRDRPDDLKRCLAALNELRLRPLQIIVVDNAPSSDATRRLVENFPNVEYVLEPKPGLSRARNAGVARCRGDIVAFTDDDVVVHPDWLRGLLRGFDSPDIWAVTGPVFPAELESEAQLLFQAGHHDFGWGYHRLTFDTAFFEHTKRKGAPVWRIGAGANMAFRREVFEGVGGFDERLGAGASGCSEDSEMWYRVLAEGGTCRYEPTAAVFHYHRGDLDSLGKQMNHYMRGHIAALLMQWQRYGHAGNLLRAYGILPAWYGAQVLSWIAHGGRPRQSTLWTQIAGGIAGTKFFWQNRSPTQSDTRLK
jgi:GT2 family glycosyltransferase